LPATALIFDAKGTRVMIVGAGNKLQYQPVAVGRDYGTSIGIESGLQGNEAIVKQPTVSLQEGRVVKPIESKNASGS
jgi:multidrug efflux pump subunit AcrA (membrane-fusion protein)